MKESNFSLTLHVLEPKLGDLSDQRALFLPQSLFSFMLFEYPKVSALRAKGRDVLK